MQIHIPGEQDRDVLMQAGDPKSPYTADGSALGTKSYDRIRCKGATSNGFPGEGFIVTTSAGLKYTFDIGIRRAAGNLFKPNYSEASGGPGGMDSIHRTKVYLAVSKVEDRFGNVVDYVWSGDRLQSIRSNDGRRIDLAWNAGGIASAGADGKTWTYQASVSPRYLKVTLPDASYWEATLSGSTLPPYNWNESFSGDPFCPEQLEAYLPPEALPVMQIRHPSGAVGKFSFAWLRHRRSGLPVTACNLMYRRGELQVFEMGIPAYFDLFSLGAKEISGAGLTTRRWTYTYGGVSAYRTNQIAPCGECQQDKPTLVVEPDGTTKEYRFGVVWQGNDGRLLATYTRDASGTIVGAETTTYAADAYTQDAPYADFIGYGTSGDDPMRFRNRPVIAASILRDGRLDPPAEWSYPNPSPPGTPPGTPCTGNCEPPPPPVCDPATRTCQNPEAIPAASTASARNTPARSRNGPVRQALSGPDARKFRMRVNAFDALARPTSVTRWSEN